MSFYTNMQFYMNTLLPEIFFSIGILIQLIFNLIVRKTFFPNTRSLNYSFFSQSFCLIFITVLLLLNINYDVLSNNTLLISDYSSNILKIIILIFSLFALVPISKAFDVQNLKYFEYYSLFLFSILATILFIDSNDFLSLYLLIEMQSLCFYLLASFKKDSTFSSDAGIKYFIYSSTISSLLLIALSSIYGLFGTLNFSDLNSLFFVFPFSEEFSEINNLALLSIFCVVLVLLFKLGVTPFHFWVVDVYEGAPLASTIIFSYLPKLALFNVFLKLKFIFGSAFDEFFFLFAGLGLATATFGALLALTQTRMKRFLIYSSISTTGFPIILLGYDINAISSSVFFFLVLYIAGVIFSWTFYVLLNQFIERESLLKTLKNMSTSTYLTDLKSFKGEIDFLVFLFILSLFSLAGIPPFSGFVSKFIVIAYLVRENAIIVSLILTFIGAVSTFYYVRLVKILAFESKLKDKFVSGIYNDKLSNPLDFHCCIVLIVFVYFFFFSFIFLDFLLSFSNVIQIRVIF